MSTLRMVLSCVASVACCRAGDVLYQDRTARGMVGGTVLYALVGAFWLVALRSGPYARALVVWEVVCILSEFPALLWTRAALTGVQWAGLAVLGLGAVLFSLGDQGP